MAANDAARDEFHSEIDALRKDLDQLRKDLTGLTKSGRDVASDSVEAARQSLQNEADELVERLRGVASGAKTQGSEVLDEIERTVAERPVTSLLAAFGTGLALGWLANRGK